MADTATPPQDPGAGSAPKDFTYDVPGGDMELDSAGVGLRSENEDGLSPEADRPVGDTRPAPAERPSRRREEPAPRRQAAPAASDDDEEDDEGLDGDRDRRAARADGEDGREPRSVRRGMERRHEKLRRRVDDATRELRETERLLEARRRELAGLPRQDRPAGERPAGTAARADAPPAERPKRPRLPKWSEFEKAGKTWEDYEAAQAKYDEDLDQYDTAMASYLQSTATRATDERLASTRLSAAQQRAHAAHTERMQRFRETHEDWREIEADLEGLESPFLFDAIFAHEKGDEILAWCGRHRDLADDLVDLPLTNAMMAAVRSSANPVPILQYLAEHPTETERIARLPYSPALKALGALEARLDGATADAPPRGSSRDARRSPAAPPPSQRAGQRSGAPSRDPHDESVDTYVQRRTREERDRKLAAYGLRSAS